MLNKLKRFYHRFTDTQWEAGKLLLKFESCGGRLGLNEQRRGEQENIHLWCVWWFIIYQTRERKKLLASEREKPWHFDLSTAFEIPLYGCKTSILLRFLIKLSKALQQFFLELLRWQGKRKKSSHNIVTRTFSLWEIDFPVQIPLLAIRTEFFLVHRLSSCKEVKMKKSQLLWRNISSFIINSHHAPMRVSRRFNFNSSMKHFQHWQWNLFLIFIAINRVKLLSDNFQCHSWFVQCVTLSNVDRSTKCAEEKIKSGWTEKCYLFFDIQLTKTHSWL